MRYALAVLVALIVSASLPRVASADQQRDPALKDLLQKIIGSSDCFTDKYKSEVWYKSMEPRLVHFVPTHEARVEILNHVFCEAKRDPNLQIPPDLVLALAEALAAGVAPETVISYHSPPEAFSPLPLACPGALSPA